MLSSPSTLQWTTSFILLTLFSWVLFSLLWEIVPTPWANTDKPQKRVIGPESLEMEITENVLIDNSDVALSNLRQLDEMGVRISIDDFGTGYSSLSYLKRFPIHALKIDQSFVRGIAKPGKGTSDHPRNCFFGSGVEFKNGGGGSGAGSGESLPGVHRV